MTILVDSSVWIDFFNGRASPEALHLRQIVSTTRVLVGDLILAEVLQGFSDTREFDQARAALLRFPVATLVGRRLAVLSAQNDRSLRRRGKTIRSTIDCLIATYCIVNGYTLLHSDRDYSPFEQELGLSVLHI